MIIFRQFQQKVKSHGLLPSLFYSGTYLFSFLAKPFRNFILKTWSQAGEDQLLDLLLHKKKKGFYVDVGAHHPTKLSNTKRFYDRGWWGINIEPNPDWHRLFTEQRPSDINLCCGAGNAQKALTYYEMKQAGYSTFDPEQAEQAKRLGASVKRTCQIPVRPLRDIFSEHIDHPIDFLSIDIEGFEEEALNSNDWDRWRPCLICIEAASDTDVRNEPMLKERDKYFEKLNYRRVDQTNLFGRVLNAIYEDMRPTTS